MAVHANSTTASVVHLPPRSGPSPDPLLWRSVFTDADRRAERYGEAGYRRLLSDLQARQDGDVVLFELSVEWEASVERCEKAAAALDDASERHVAPAIPEALFWRKGEPFAVTLTGEQHYGGRRWYGFPRAMDELRLLRLVDICDRPLVRDQARRDEIVEAYERWSAESKAAADACGLTAAIADDEDAHKENASLRRRIMVLPAFTLAGALVKAKVAGWCWGGSTEMGEQIAHDAARGEVCGENIAFSAVADLVAMIERAAS